MGNIMYRWLVTLCISLMPLFGTSAELLMVHEKYCFWCDAWENEIGPIYAKTAEGKFAPISKIELAHSMNDNRIQEIMPHAPLNGQLNVFGYPFFAHLNKHQFSDPPEPSRSSSRCSGSTVLAYPSGPLKVIKNDEKSVLWYTRKH